MIIEVTYPDDGRRVWFDVYEVQEKGNGGHTIITDTADTPDGWGPPSGSYITVDPGGRDPETRTWQVK